MLYLLISLIGILVTIIFVIGTHEYAHFIAARLFGVKVLRFSIGFGKKLCQWKDKKGTEYVFALIPLGGYVKMLDEHEGKVDKEELHLAYNRQPFYKKFLIVLAGPTANILCALILYWIIFTIGFTTIRPVIGQIKTGSIAAEANMTPNQEIIEIGGSRVSSWNSILLRLITHAGNEDHITLTTRPFPNKKDSSSKSYTLDLTHWHLDSLSPDPLTSIGIVPYAPPLPLIIGLISPDSPVASTLKIKDKIIAINKKPVSDWNELVTIITQQPEKTIIFSIIRGGEKLNIPIQVGYKYTWSFKKRGYLGIGPKVVLPENLLQEVKYNPLNAFTHAAKELVDFTSFNLILFGKLFTGKLSLQSLGGPITIFETAGQALNGGLLIFLGFLAFLSISIGIINLLPIPGLDGGHLVFQTIEAISGKPIPEKWLLLFYRLGFILILFVLIQSFINDVLRMY